MSETKDEVVLDRRPLLEPPDNFRVLIDIDGKQWGAVLTALNGKSMLAMLQFVMLVNPKRITGYIVQKEPLIVGSQGELVAVVPAGSYVGQMVKHSRLKDPAPKDPPSVELPYWNTFEFNPKGPLMPDAKMFYSEIVIDGVAEKYPVSGANGDSLVALFTAAMCTQVPRISGFNLYDENGKMIVSVAGMHLLAKLSEISPLGKQPADPKTAGWRANQAVASVSEEFQKSVEAAKKAGKNPT